MNKYRVVSSWDDLQKKEVMVEADTFVSEDQNNGKIKTTFVSGMDLPETEPLDIVAVFWGEVIVIKQP